MDEPTVVVGAVTKAHGLRGEVSIQIRSDNPDRFAVGSTVLLPDGRTLTVERAQRHGKALLVRFTQVADRNAAEAIRGQELSVPESWLPALDDGEYWPFQLEGCTVTTEAGRALGTLTDVIANPANDLWVARDDDGTETLVPALRDVIVEVDIEAKRVVVRDVPGLTIPDED
ncbi:MAG: ribosome maturation factor RimM [Actinomycetota bacterium]